MYMFEYHDLMTVLHRLNEWEDRFVLLKAQGSPMHSDSDWLERIVGRDGHWAFDPSDVVHAEAKAEW
jgi:hypothetical protein